MLAVTAVLLLVVMSGRFIKYMAEAAAKGFSPEVLMTVMAYRLPGFLELILPLGLFLGILMAYGRLYLDSEMTVLSACGMSMRRLVIITLIPALLVSLAVAYLSLDLSPRGARHAQELFDEQRNRTEFDLLTPGRFQTLGKPGQVAYTQSLTGDARDMKNVFISQLKSTKAGETELTLLIAESGYQRVDEATGSHFLVMNNGYRYDGEPGTADYRVTSYDKYAIKLPRPKAVSREVESEMKPTAELFNSTSPGDIAQLQWRISLPLLVPIVALIAVPLSRVSPRQGRYMRLLPSIFLYMGYVTLLSVARSAVGDGTIPVWLGLWWIHLLFLGIGLALLGNLHHKLPWVSK